MAGKMGLKLFTDMKIIVGNLKKDLPLGMVAKKDYKLLGIKERKECRWDIGGGKSVQTSVF